MSIAREQEAKLWELRAAACLARLRRDQDRRTEARDLLARVYGRFTERFRHDRSKNFWCNHALDLVELGVLYWMALRARRIQLLIVNTRLEMQRVLAAQTAEMRRLLVPSNS